MATLPDGMKSLAVTPVNFEEIIELSQANVGNPRRGPYTEDELKRIRSQAQAKNSVAMVIFMDQSFWHEEENVARAIHDTGDWRGDR